MFLYLEGFFENEVKKTISANFTQKYFDVNPHKVQILESHNNFIVSSKSREIMEISTAVAESCLTLTFSGMTF